MRTALRLAAGLAAFCSLPVAAVAWFASGLLLAPLFSVLAEGQLRLTVDLGKNADEWQWGAVHVAAPDGTVLGTVVE